MTNRANTITRPRVADNAALVPPLLPHRIAPAPRARINSAQNPVFPEAHAMTCPKCKSPMELVTYDDITVDRCTNCKGIWFDAGEQKLLKDKRAADTVDTGDTSTGKKMDKIHDIQCPRCNRPMIRMVEVDTQAIDYEACTQCFGIFLDAGEFKHLKNSGMSDYLRGLFGVGKKK
jgi:Zn-finger nucleic acid-binding protein